MYRVIGEPWFNWCIAGPLSRVESTIRGKLGQFKRYAAKNYTGRLKIGATNDPYTRWRDHKRQGIWAEMVVLWQTASYDGIKRAESSLIEWAEGYRDVECMNFVGGGGGVKPGANRYYVYVLLG